MPHSLPVLAQHVEQPADFAARFNALVDGGCVGFGGTSGLPLACEVERGMRIANVRWALNADLITLGRAVDLFLAEAIGERVERQQAGRG